MPLFSVIVPIFNKERFVELCSESVLRQSFRDFELLLVDDGSFDDSPRICDQIAEKNPCVKVVHKQNGGLSDARNVGLKEAEGEYILFLDGDDYYGDVHMLAELKNIIDQERPDVIVYGAKKKYHSMEMEDGWLALFSEKDYKKYNNKTMYLMQRNIIQSSAWSKAIKRECLEKNHIQFIKGQLSEDVEWTLKLLMCTEKIAVIPKAYYIYQQNNDSISHNVGIKNCKDISEIICRYASTNDEAVLHYLANQYLIWLTATNYVKTEQVKTLLLEMRRYYYLLDYDWYPYVRKAKRLKWIGYPAMRKLLGVYRKLLEARRES